MSKLEKQKTGGWVNSTLSPGAVKLIQKFSDSPRLIESIGTLLGRYKLVKEFHTTNPPDHKTAKHIKRIVNGLIELQDDLDRLPESFKVFFFELLTYKRGYELNEAFGELRQFKQKLSEYQVYFAHIRNKKYIGQSPVGEKPKHHERELLSDVAEIIEKADPGYGLMNSAELASKILNACGVHNIPHDKAKARERIRSYRKQYPKIAPQN